MIVIQLLSNFTDHWDVSVLVSKRCKQATLNVPHICDLMFLFVSDRDKKKDGSHKLINSSTDIYLQQVKTQILKLQLHYLHSFKVN